MIRPALPPAAALAAALLFCSAGCQPADEIRTYTVPKESAAASTPAAPPAAATPSRMIAAMLEGDQRAWFFKVMGPVEPVEEAATAIKEFISSVEFDEESSRPVWQTPDGWTERPASQMRLATLVIPTSGEPVELSVIGLGLADDWDASVVDNVNRWRGQLGLEPLTADETDSLESLQLDERRAVIVDLTGEANAAAMMPPMAGGMAGRMPAAPPATRTPPTGPPASEPPHGAQPKPVAYELPEGWRELPPAGLRVINVRVGEGDKEAELTGMAFPAAAPEIANVLSNANRWRGEIGLPPVEESQLGEITEKIEIDGGEATYFKLLDPAKEQGTLAAMVQRGSMIWFFKLRGPSETMAGSPDAFRDFLSSVHFNQQ